MTVGIAVFIVERRVLRLMGIFSQHGPRSFVQADACIPCIHIFRQVIHVRWVGIDILHLLVFIHPRASNAQSGVVLLQRGNPLVKTYLTVSTRYQAAVPTPVAALLTREHLQRNTLDGLHYQTGAQQRVIDTQRALLVGTENKSRAELLVEGAQRQVVVAHLQLHPGIRQTTTLEVVLKAWQRLTHIFIACTTIHITALHQHIYISIGIEGAVLHCSRLTVALRQ